MSSVKNVQCTSQPGPPLEGLEKIILQSMELFPTVLEEIIIKYITRKEITFQPFNNHKGLTISDDGRTLSVKQEDKIRCYSAISPTPLSQCKLRWKVQVLSDNFYFFIGIAFPGCISHGSHVGDISDSGCVYFSLFNDNNGQKYILIPSDPSNSTGGGHYSKYSFKSSHVIMEVDLIQRTFSVNVNEIDQMILIDYRGDKIMAGKIPIATDIENLEECFPFVALTSQNQCALVVTSF